MIRERRDLDFLFLTKRIERFNACIPEDRGDGWENVTVGCSVENREAADRSLPIFVNASIKHRNMVCQPMIGAMDILPHLQGIEHVIVEGESDTNARPLDYEWVLSVRQQCIEHNTRFIFRQCGTHFIKDGRDISSMSVSFAVRRGRRI